MNGSGSIAIMVGVILLYLWIGCGVVMALTAVRVRRRDLAAAVVFGLLTGVACVGLLPIALGLRLMVVGALSLVAEAGLYLAALRPSLDWQALKFGKQSARQTTLHLVLLSGSVIFLVPFAWLIVTSLKEESEMSRFPPVWIPTQQIEVTVDGAARKLATTDHNGARVRVAVMQEFDTGQRRVRVLPGSTGAGSEFEVSKDALTEVRHVAPVWKNYLDALKFLPPETHYGLVFLRNTLVISILSIIGTLISSSMVAYSFARLRWPGRDALFVVLLATMMLPSAVTMMPNFLIFRWLGWVDTLQALWAPSFFGVAFNIFLLRQFFLGIPNELEDAAKIDGCSYYTIFVRIMLPQIKPALAAITIMAFMGKWNDFMGPLIYISSPEKEPLAYALQLYQSSHSSEPALLMAASTLVMLPVLGLFFFTQRYFIQGITLTGIKG
jgi:multiple sugar transport system permease protein